MADPFPGESRKKADGVADVINRLLQDLVIRCAREEGVRDFFHIGVIGYGAHVGPAFSGPLAGREMVPISEIGNMPGRVEERAKKVEDGAGGLIDQTVRFPIWFDPVANGGTPMCQALGRAQNILQGWLAQHPTCFPPVVIHITDGESTDGDPSIAMQGITGLTSNDGNVLLFNIHLSSNPHAKEIQFPDSSALLPDQYARTLFDCASVLTPFMRSLAMEDYDLNLSDGAKSFVLNANPVLVIQALNIGTSTSNLR